MRLLQKEHLLIFQSTLPDPRSRAQVTAIARFQSTLPAWGETTPVTTECPSAAVISIHSPRMGRDALADVVRSLRQTFQSTLPAWGETLKRERSGRATPISIHSPRMGRDPSGTPPVVGAWHFNPLSPHGERRSIRRSRTSSSPFQSTLPAWGETAPLVGLRPDGADFNPLSPHGERPRRAPRRRAAPPNFNPLSPHGERRYRPTTVQRSLFHFNPLSPHGERRVSTVCSPESIRISIHSPRMGRDHNGTQSNGKAPNHISIHSPRMGRDQTCPFRVDSNGQFQSTLPAWGETRWAERTRLRTG